MATSQKDDLPVWDTVSEPDVQIECGGDAIKPFLHTAREIADESRLRFDKSGVHTDVLDPANVCMMELDLSADAFNSYAVNGHLTTGGNLKRLKGLVRGARMHHDDHLALTVSRDEFRAEVSREYDDARMTTTDAIRTIDPDAVRQEDMPDRSGLDIEYESVTLSVDVFTDAIEHVSDTAEHVALSTDDGLRFEGHDRGGSPSGVRLDGVGSAVDGRTLFSKDYLTQFLTALSKSRAEELTMYYQTEYPMFVEFETDHLSGEYCLAPRLQSE